MPVFYKSNTRSGLVQVGIKTKDLTMMEAELQKIINKASKEATRTATYNTFKLIDASGNVPKDTGRLKMAGKQIVKDKFRANSYLMGWTTPYAKVRYFGVGQERVWRRINGKNRQLILGKNGIPFWDRPITSNTGLMLGIWKQALGKSLRRSS